jgi:hypothetical protein
LTLGLARAMPGARPHLVALERSYMSAQDDGAPRAEKLERRVAESLRKYSKIPAPGAFRAALGAQPDVAALMTPEGLEAVQAELRALKHERRALRRLENLLLAALGRDGGQAGDGDDEE